MTEHDFDVAIIGAGPAGLASACECKDRGLTYVLLDRRGLAQSFHEYPNVLRFFSPADEMEIGGVPLPVTGGDKPTREQYLAYLRAVVRGRKLELSTWEEVVSCTEASGGYVLETRLNPCGDSGRRIRCRGIILATGVWGDPHRLNVSGGQGANVFSKFIEPTPFCGQPVLVVGGGNSALGAALSLMEARAQVTLSMRRPPLDYRCGVRPFVKRNLDFAVNEGKLQLCTDTLLCEIGSDFAVLQPVRYTGSEELTEGSMDDYQNAGAPFRIKCRFVFSLLGHRPESGFIRNIMGLKQRPDCRPICDLRTWRTERRRIVVAGSLADPSIDILLRIRDQAREAVKSLVSELLYQGGQCESTD